MAEGERLFGYLPMSTELVIRPTQVSTGSLTDGSAHRAALPIVYNNYERCSATPGHRVDLEAEQMLYRPLFFTSFLIDDRVAIVTGAGGGLDLSSPEIVEMLVARGVEGAGDIVEATTAGTAAVRPSRAAPWSRSKTSSRTGSPNENPLMATTSPG